MPVPRTGDYGYLPLYLAEFSYRHNNRKNLNIFVDLVAGC